ncbi:MAG: hypothetical protein WEC59_06925 [Salibacteraceae bacterium]
MFLYHNKLKSTFFGSVILLVVLSLWSLPDANKIRLDKIGFHVNDSDYLYFNNLRLFYYQIEAATKGEMRVLRLKK